MMRRWVALLAAVFVLFGAISPAIACAVQARHGDCCPGGSKMPCDGPARDRAISVTECFVTGSHVPSSSLTERGAQLEQPAPGYSPHPLIAAAWLATLPLLSPATSPPGPPHTFLVRDDGEPLYLRTRRLRL